MTLCDFPLTPFQSKSYSICAESRPPRSCSPRSPSIEGSNHSSCGHVYTIEFPAPNCNLAEAVITPVRSTDSKIIPLLWAVPDVRSSRYGFGITNASGCYVSLPQYPTKHRFYNRDGEHAGAAYFTLGQTSRPCIDFTVSVLSYDGVQRLVPYLDDCTLLDSRKQERL